MGAYQNNPTAKKGTSRKRGSTNNKGRLDAFGSRDPAAGGDWGGSDARRIQAVIVGITRLGGAVTFGLSRDMGAHSLTLMLDDDRQTLWFNGDAELDTELDEVLGKLEAMHDSGA